MRPPAARCSEYEGERIAWVPEAQPLLPDQLAKRVPLRAGAPIRSADVRAAITQNLQASADLRLRGTAANPGLLGRISASQGQVPFFGNDYRIDQGSISFFNPGAIEPILNVDPETRVSGVAVIVTVSGPIRQLQMSYRSDPPLPFSDILVPADHRARPPEPT